MRKLEVIEHISLDGVIQVSGEGGVPYGDWTAPYRTPAGRDVVLAAHGERFDLLLGRRTYDAWSGYWPKAPSSPMAELRGRRTPEDRLGRRLSRYHGGGRVTRSRNRPEASPARNPPDVYRPERNHR